MMKDKKVLIIGNGGREHAIGWKISQSPQVSQIFFAPGNGGTQNIGQNIDIKVTDIEKLLQTAKDRKIDLTIVGPELPLSQGLVNRFEAENLAILGPTKEAAEIETSKVWARIFLQKIGVPGPEFAIFDNPKEALTYVSVAFPCVVKADGLAAGKGVIVCQNREQAREAVKKIMIDKVFGEAGNRLVVEEFLEGQEVSVIAFCDGDSFKFLIPARDYKRSLDNDRGLNTGGMGALAPATFLNQKQLDLINFQIFQPVLAGLKKIGRPYKGTLYAGLMLTDDGIKVLEFNCRFGDPETQVQLPLLKTDLYKIMEACVFGELEDINVEFTDQSAICVVLASYGYPQKYEVGQKIEGLNTPLPENIIIFHAGTKKEGNQIKTSGGRILNVVAIADSLNYAREKAYQLINNPVAFEGMYYRKDIGMDRS